MVNVYVYTLELQKVVRPVKPTPTTFSGGGRSPRDKNKERQKHAVGGACVCIWCALKGIPGCGAPNCLVGPFIGFNGLEQPCRKYRGLAVSKMMLLQVQLLKLE